MSQGPEFEEQVEWMVTVYVDWLTNMQRNAIAEGAVLEAEVITEAFRRLLKRYEILDNMPDIDDEFMRQFFKEEE